MGTRGVIILARNLVSFFSGRLCLLHKKNIKKRAYLGPLAQSVEQRTFNPWVVGSIPTGPTNFD